MPVRPTTPAADGPTGTHPLASVLRAALAGSWPVADGSVDILPAWRAGVTGIVALTGRAYLCTDRPLEPGELADLGCDGFGGATLPAVVSRVAGPGAWIDCLDALLMAPGRGGPGPLIARPDLAEHPRAVNAGRSRGQVRVLGYADAVRSDLVTLATGLAGLTEAGVEAAQPGSGSRLFADALTAVPIGEPLVAGVAPGNARSLRSALRAGFEVIGSVQIIVDRPHPAREPGHVGSGSR